MKTKKIHYISGIGIALFVFAHLINHLTATFGFEVHIATMNTLRTIYRNVFVESILLFLVVIQIFSGVKLFFKNRHAPNFFDKLQNFSGLYLSMFFCIHIGAVFWGRVFLQLDTNIYFGIAGLNTFPFTLFFVPYYSLAIVAFFSHVAAIHSKKMKSPVFGVSVVQQSSAIISAGLLLAVALIFVLTDGFKGASFPTEYNILVGN